MTASGNMADRIVQSGRSLMMQRGYNGFSYADVAMDVGIRKASIHHHFPTKADLTVAVVEQSRAMIQAEAAALETEGANALTRLRRYTTYWEHCIADGSAPFCLAAVLAAELPSLPQPVGAAVEAHFRDLAAWLTAVLERGLQDGSLRFCGPAEAEADRFMAATYGAMLAARAFKDPRKFATIIGAQLDGLEQP